MQVIEVRHPYDGALVETVSVAGPDDVEDAVAAAQAGAGVLAGLPAWRRGEALARVADQLREEADDLAATIVAESGKPRQLAGREVERAISTFRWASEEARRWSGELQRLDGDRSGEGRMAVIRRFPRGPILGITPFNFPLNLVAHKVAPALAVGAPVVIKPSPRTPLSALRLGRLVAECGLPGAAMSVLPVPNDAVGDLLADPRLPVISFTGSGTVSDAIRRAVPDKHLLFELGGNAAVIVHDGADVEVVARQVAVGAFTQAGQSCISVQRVLVQDDLAGDFRDALVAAAQKMVTGDPADPGTEVGPMIDEDAARRVEEWIGEALDAGGRLLTGGTRQGTAVAPTIVEGVPPECRLSCEEAFAPVVTFATYGSIDEAFDLVNASKFGLQAGLCTRDLNLAFRAHSELQVGGVVIGDVPTYRSDAMPYGGTKGSGEGREGVRFAMEDFTYPRAMVLTGVSL